MNMSGEGRGGVRIGRFLEKVMSHYENLDTRTTELQTDRQTDRVSCRGASLLKTILNAFPYLIESEAKIMA